MTSVTTKMNTNVSNSSPFNPHPNFHEAYWGFSLPPEENRRDVNWYDRERRFFAFHVKEIMRYLADHDHEKLQVAQLIEKQCKYPGKVMKRRLREALGETHWRRYLAYYKHFLRTGKRTKIDLCDSHEAAVPPPLPKLVESLNVDVTGVIFSFLDGKAMYEASKVSRAFRDAFIPRQRNVTTAGFSTKESFRSMNFLGAEYLYVKGKHKWLTEEDVLPSIVEFPSMPNLRRVKVSSRRIARCGESRAIREMGPRLEWFKGYDYGVGIFYSK